MHVVSVHVCIMQVKLIYMLSGSHVIRETRPGMLYALLNILFAYSV